MPSRTSAKWNTVLPLPMLYPSSLQLPLHQNPQDSRLWVVALPRSGWRNTDRFGPFAAKCRNLEGPATSVSRHNILSLHLCFRCRWKAPRGSGALQLPPCSGRLDPWVKPALDAGEGYYAPLSGNPALRTSVKPWIPHRRAGRPRRASPRAVDGACFHR